MSDRFFSSTPIEFTAPGATLVRLEETEAHHLMHVMRLGVGARVTLFDGSGAEFPAEVKELSRRDAVLAVLSREEISREPAIEVHLGVAMPKGDRQKVLVEKLTELGVARLTPVLTEHGVVELRATALQKLRRAVIEASKQCGRNRLMSIDEPQPLSEFLKASLSAERLIAHPQGEPLARSSPTGQRPRFPRCLLVPRAGFRKPRCNKRLRRGGGRFRWADRSSESKLRRFLSPQPVQSSPDLGKIMLLPFLAVTFQAPDACRNRIRFLAWSEIMADSLSGAARAGGGVFVLLGCLCGAAAAQPVVDGDLAGDASAYGAALSVQTANSGFGNATNGDQRFANGGSEIDQVFGYVSGSRLHVLITGNLESNFNKLNVFIDSQAGGVNQINGNNLPAMVDPFCCGNPPTDVGALQRMNGLSFDSGFTADHLLIFSNGVESVGTSSTYSISSYYANLTQGAAGDKSEIGFHRFARGMEPGLAQGEPIDQLNNACTGPTDTSCTPFEHELAEPQDFVGDPSNSRNHRNFLNDIELRYAIDNSNTQGVNFGFGAATGNPQDVETGIEFSIPLSVIGATTDDIRVTAFIGSGPHNFVSNQFSGAGTPGGNLGANYFSINLANIAGDQFVTVPGGLPGDFNGDGSVDAADYTVWRDGLGGEYLAGDYQLWADNFGATASAVAASVPEPTAALLLMLAAGLAPSRRGSK